MLRKSTCNAGLGLTMLLIGAAAGAVTALLLTPKTGQQMRRMLRRKVEDARQTIEDIREEAGEVLERGADLAREAKDVAKEKMAPLTRVVGAH